MKQFVNLPLAALLAAGAHAQTSTMVNDPKDTGVVTQYFTICPSTVTNTYTMSNTITVCPGNNCNGGNPPVITVTPIGGRPGGKSSEILAFTTTGADGRVTELHEYITVYDQWCTESGWQQATYTVTQECPCSTRPTIAPDFTTTVVKCGSCGKNGEATAVTLTQPCTTGAYATVTPDVGPGAFPGQPGSAGNPASGNNGADSGSGVGSGAGSGAGAGSGTDSESGTGSGAGAGVGTGAGAGSGFGAGTTAGAGAGAGAGSDAGTDSVAGSGSGSSSDMGIGNSIGGAAPSKTAGGTSEDMDSSSSEASNMSGSGSNNTMPPVMSGSMTKPSASTYTGGTNKTVFTISTLLVALVGSLAWLL